MEDPAQISPQEERHHTPAESEKAPGGTNTSQFFVQARENTLVKFVLYETKPVPAPAPSGSFCAFIIIELINYKY